MLHKTNRNYPPPPQFIINEIIVYITIVANNIFRLMDGEHNAHTKPWWNPCYLSARGRSNRSTNKVPRGLHFPLGGLQTLHWNVSFTGFYIGAVELSLIHSYKPPIKRQGTTLPWAPFLADHIFARFSHSLLSSFQVSDVWHLKIPEGLDQLTSHRVMYLLCFPD